MIAAAGETGHLLTPYLSRDELHEIRRFRQVQRTEPAGPANLVKTRHAGTIDCDMRKTMRMARILAPAVLLVAALQAYGSPQGPAATPKSMAADANPAITVATIKPSDPNRPGWTLGTKGTHFFTVGTNMNDLITFAFGVHAKQIVGGPAWFLTDKFDIEGVPDAEGKPTREQLKSMVQGLLADRFKLAVHHDKRELAVYALRSEERR